jgi:hypothetical protein
MAQCLLRLLIVRIDGPGLAARPQSLALYGARRRHGDEFSDDEECRSLLNGLKLYGHILLKT